MIIIVVIIVLLFVAYNIYRYPARFRNLSNGSLSEEKVQALKEELAAAEEKKVLVAYFSYSGTTRNVANSLSGFLGFL